MLTDDVDHSCLLLPTNVSARCVYPHPSRMVWPPLSAAPDLCCSDTCCMCAAAIAAAHMLFHVASDLCCSYQLLHGRRCLASRKAGLTMSQHCNVEVGSLSIRSRHSRLICAAGCAFSRCPLALLPCCLNALLPCCLIALLPFALLPCCLVAWLPCCLLPCLLAALQQLPYCHIAMPYYTGASHTTPSVPYSRAQQLPCQLPHPIMPCAMT